MLSTVNPTGSTATPGMSNPTGVAITGPLAAGSTYTNPYLTGSALGYVPGSPATPSTTPTSGTTPTATDTTLGATTAPPLTIPGGGPLGVTIGQNAPGVSPKDTARLLKELQHVYGKGIGSALYQFLTTGAGYNPNVVEAEIQQMQPQIQRGYNTLQEQFAAAGAGGSSAAGIGGADYLSQVTADENALFAQQYEQAINNYMNILMGVKGEAATYTANKPSELDTILGYLNTAASVGLDIAGIFKKP